MATQDQIAQFKLDNWPYALAVSKQIGIDPRIVMAQAAIESDWGSKAPGNNLFGIKGPGQVQPTMEAGPDGKLYPTQDSFRTFDTPAHSFAGYANLPIIQKVGQAGDYDSQIAALGRSGYATAPNYSSVVDRTARDLTVPKDVQPGLLPIVGTQAINGLGAGGQGVLPPDPRDVFTAPTAPADVTGQGTGPMPTPAVNTAALAGLLAQGRIQSAMQSSQGLLAQGQPQATWTPQAVPMLQINRPRGSGQLPLIINPRGLLG